MYCIWRSGNHRDIPDFFKDLPPELVGAVRSGAKSVALPTEAELKERQKKKETRKEARKMARIRLLEDEIKAIKAGKTKHEGLRPAPPSPIMLEGEHNG